MIRGVHANGGGPRWRLSVVRRRCCWPCPGFVVLVVSEYAGELGQAVETTADLIGCPGCGAVAQLHDRRPIRVRDLPIGGRPVTLIWVKQVWRCRYQQCGVVTW